MTEKKKKKKKEDNNLACKRILIRREGDKEGSWV